MTSNRMAIAVSVLLACSLPTVAQEDMGFDINITLSKRAAAKLAAEKEGIVALASYYTVIPSGAPRSTPTRSAKSAFQPA